MSIALYRRRNVHYSHVYLTWEDAERRVEILRDFGIWPGIRIIPGGYTLTFDIALSMAEIKARHW